MKTKDQKAQIRKEQRLVKKIFEIIKDKKAIFLTMSFNNEIIKKTSAETRRRYIKTFLKNETAIYIANKDYGKRKGREHYHAIIRASALKIAPSKYKNILYKINLKAFKYGNIQAEIIGQKYRFKNLKEIKETAKILKDHYLKETTRNSKLIYSRGKPTRKQELNRLNRLYKSLIIETNQEKKSDQ